jgi:glutamine amidotransferase PdxT
VLALQGDFEAHAKAMSGLPVEVREVRRVADLDASTGSSCRAAKARPCLNLMADEPWFDALKAFHDRGGRPDGDLRGSDPALPLRS